MCLSVFDCLFACLLACLVAWLLVVFFSFICVLACISVLREETQGSMYPPEDHQVGSMHLLSSQVSISPYNTWIAFFGMVSRSTPKPILVLEARAAPKSEDGKPIKNRIVLSRRGRSTYNSPG